MKKVDRLGWTAGISFKAYGVSVGIRVNDPAALDAIPALMPPEWEQSDEPVVDSLFSLRVGPVSRHKGRRNYHLLYAGAARVSRTLELEEALDKLENLLHITVAYWAKEDHLFVHAGVVGWQGKAIVIPGRSFTGKTTLVSELIKAGATYYSDDMAVFDPTGRVHPYPVPLSVRESQGRCKYTPDHFGAEAGREPLPVGLVLITSYEEGASWRPRSMTPGRALVALLDNTVAARRDPRVSLPILNQVVANAPAIKTKRGEASAIANQILARAAAA
ncbi:MAG: hypothetical protein HC802_06720 [Caldilineaceae bacterium]|nr:hypothetical protein [Caldilineaceae bacterium]